MIGIQVASFRVLESMLTLKRIYCKYLLDPMLALEKILLRTYYNWSTRSNIDTREDIVKLTSTNWSF